MNTLKKTAVQTYHENILCCLHRLSSMGDFLQLSVITVSEIFFA